MSDRIGSLRAAGNLRSLTHRLASASTKQLPALIPQIVRALPDCRLLLAASEQNVKKESVDAVVLHRFNTQISTLLAHRSPEGRWAAVVLIKACIGLGGHVVLARCGPWVRGLINILNKPNPLSTQKLCVITLTRIFELTRDYQTLVREITTPSLPVFVTACLKLADWQKDKPSSASSNLENDLIQTILRSFRCLLPNHPSIFRNFRTQLQPLLAPLVAPTPATQDANASISSSDPKVVDTARSVFVLLHFTAPKSGSSSEYSTTFSELITEAHDTADRVFRAVLESWRSMTDKASPNVPHDGDILAPESSLGFPKWNGIYAGCERLSGLLALLQKFVSTQTAAAVSIPLGHLIDLLLRICTITIPPSRESAQNVKLNENISREEREALWSQLPGIHAVALDLISSLCQRLDTGVQPLHQTFIEMIAWVFRHEHQNELVRNSSYAAASAILESSGSGLSKDYVTQLGLVVTTSCTDIIPTPNRSDDKQGLEDALDAAVASISNLPQQHSPSGKSTTVLRSAAIHLLTTVLSRVPAEYLSRSLRSQLDQTAVLCNDSRLMIASVLNPSLHKALEKAYSSILPFLARSKPELVETEGLLRPRMPVVRTEAGEVDEALEEVEDEDEHLASSGPKDDEFIPDDVDQTKVSETQDTPFSVEGKEADTPTSTSPHPEIPVQNTHLTSLPAIGDSSESHKRVPSNELPLEPGPKRPRLEPHAPSRQVKSHVEPLDQPKSQSQPIVIGTLNKAPSSQLRAEPPIDIPAEKFDVEDDEDDDDFVVPELTLEPDTEDEDESEDNAEAEAG